jgi:hypothetical protein
LNPIQIPAHFGVYSRIVFQGTAIAPGDNSLELSIADYRATGVILGCGRTDDIKSRLRLR